MIFRVARVLGKSVDELCASMDVHEFIYWQAYLDLEAAALKQQNHGIAI